ncbi:carboxypeptidase regulatory-like domain-containing protein, partial [bacterium]|nr:carboxypeptidase regulatory-like domain-containing protein [bacterium]
VGQYYDHVSDIQDSTAVPVSAGEDVTGIDAALDTYATITGTVTDVTNANPLPSTYVRIYSFDTNRGEWTQTSGDYNDGSGVYTISGLTPGTYRVYFEKSGYIYEYYDNQYSVLSAQDIVVGSGDVATVNGALSAGASITGTLTDPLSDPAAQVTATALRWDEDYGQWVVVNSDSTDGSGFYNISGLGDGIYRVNFTDSQYRFAEEYYDDAATIGSALDVEVASGQDTPNVNAQLAAYADPETGAVAGTVKSDADGTPREGIVVWVSQYQPALGGWTDVAQLQTLADGSYSTDLAVGDYRFEFEDYSSAFLGEWFDDVVGGVWDATDVTVSAGATTSVDASLTPGAHIKGTVTALNGGAPLEGIGITAWRNTGDGWDWVRNDSTNYLGKYDLVGLPAGEYLLEFADYSDVYQDEYFDSASNTDEATTIQVAAGEVVTGIDAALDNAGAIQGTITDAVTGRPIEGARVTLYYGNGPWEWYSVYSEWGGTYRFPGLPPGTYEVGANDD